MDKTVESDGILNHTFKQRGEKAMEKKKVIMDVDTGSDDAIAIMMAVLSGQLDILGITVTQGNRPLTNCVENTLRVLDMLGADIPVYAGCPAPMVRDLTPGRGANNPGGGVGIVEDGVEYTIHPAYLDLPAAHSQVQKKHACSFLVEAIHAAEGKVTLIPVGPPTNIGMAFRMDPTIAQKVEEVVFMGGAVDKGNVTPVAEANFFHDPEAVKIVLDSGVKVRCITLNATHSAEISMPQADELIALGTKSGKLAGDLIHLRAKASQKMGWHSGQWEAIHDALAVAAVLDESVITDLRRQKCNIDINGGFGDGQLIVEHRNEQDLSVNTYVSYRADGEKFFAMMKEMMAKGPKI